MGRVYYGNCGGIADAQAIWPNPDNVTVLTVQLNHLLAESDRIHFLEPPQVAEHGKQWAREIA